jgi:hypothetical protein
MTSRRSCWAAAGPPSTHLDRHSGFPGPHRRLALNPPGRRRWCRPGRPAAAWAALAVPSWPPTGSVAELAAWTRSLAWRAPLVAVAGIVGDALVAQTGIPGAGLLGLAAAALVGWRLRFRPSEQACTWRRGAHGERRTARLLDRLTRDGYVVFHDLAVPGNASANVDHLVIGPSGVFVIDSKQWTGSVHQGADGLAWHNHYPLDRTLETARWEAEAVGRLLGTRIAVLVCVHGAHVQGGGLHAQGVAIVLPACSAARSAMTGSLPTPRWSCSPPPPGPDSTRPPDRSKCSGKGIERAKCTRRWVVGGPWSPTAMAARQACPVGRHGGSHHGKTTTDGHHSNARQGAREARW